MLWAHNYNVGNETVSKCLDNSTFIWRARYFWRNVKKRIGNLQYLSLNVSLDYVGIVVRQFNWSIKKVANRNEFGRYGSYSYLKCFDRNRHKVIWNVPNYDWVAQFRIQIDDIWKWCIKIASYSKRFLIQSRDTQRHLVVLNVEFRDFDTSHFLPFTIFRLNWACDT